MSTCGDVSSRLRPRRLHRPFPLSISASRGQQLPPDAAGKKFCCRFRGNIHANSSQPCHSRRTAGLDHCAHRSSRAGSRACAGHRCPRLTARPRRNIVVIGTRRTEPHRGRFRLADRCDQRRRPQHAAHRQPAGLGAQPRAVVLRRPKLDLGRFDLRARAPSLRGLPGDQLLVMLNGKRYNRSGPRAGLPRPATPACRSVRKAPTFLPFPPSRSRASKCCATARRPSMVRTPSRAC